MPAEGKPAVDESFLSAPLEVFTRWILRRSFRTALICIVLAAFSALAARRFLEFRTNRLDLLNPNDEKNRLWMEYISEFGADDDAVIVVEGPGRERIVPALQHLSERISEHEDLFHSVLHEIDLSVLQTKPFHFFPPQQLQGLAQFVQHVLPIVSRDAWDQLSLPQTLGYFSYSLRDASRLPADDPQRRRLLYQIAQLNQGIYAALSGQNITSVGWAQAPLDFSAISNIRRQYLIDQQGRIGFIFLKLADLGENSFTRGEKPITELRKLIEQAALSFPDATIGLTGLPVMEYDEMRLTQREMTEAEIVGFISVFFLFAAAFGGIRHSLLGVFTLMVAMLWTLGVTTFFPGHLNILSSAFAVVLIGSGINYPIHFAARYFDVRKRIGSTVEALAQTAREVGPGTVAGAVTTALAFYAAAFTEFTGVAELGLIGGTGLLLCLAATLVLFPTLIHGLDTALPRVSHPTCLAMEKWVNPVFRFPRVTLVVSALVVGVCSWGVIHLNYDHNLLNLQPIGVASVELERRLLDEYNQSVWFALSLSNTREELLAKEQAFKKLATVERTESLDTYLPSVYPRNAALIASLHSQLDGLPERPGRVRLDSPDTLAQAIDALERELEMQGESQLASGLFETRALLRGLSAEAISVRVGAYQQQIAGDLLTRLHTLHSLCNAAPPTLDDLPKGLVNRFVGAHGKFLLKVYAKGSTWDMDALGKFVKDVRSVDPRATGNPLQTYEASRKMQRSYEQAAFYALIWIILVIYLDFRSITHTALAMLPLAMGLLQGFGLLGWFGVPLNPANMISLPLLVGIGVEDGIHIVHDFRQTKGRYHVSRSTMVAIILNSATTIASFASLLICSHRGLFSLGRVMTVGCTCCLLTSITLLPAILCCLHREKTQHGKNDQPDDEVEGPTIRPLHRRELPLQGDSNISGHAA